MYTHHLILDGQITCNGEDGPAQSTAGGGSGGSIWITCKELSGFGSISVNGGAGSSSSGGGGSGGRIAVYHQTMSKYNGSISAKGGTSAIEDGGPGTIYLETKNESHVSYRVLKADNTGRKYSLALGKRGYLQHGIYGDISGIGCVLWFNETETFAFDEFYIYGNVHVGLYGGGVSQKVHFYSRKLFGDRNAIFHIGRNQIVTFDIVDIYYPINTHVYRNGSIEVPSRLSLREVWMEVNGTLSEAHDYVIDRSGELYLWSAAHSKDEKAGVFVFGNISVRSRGRLYLSSQPQGDQIILNTTRFVVNAGGVVKANNLLVSAVNATVDVGGNVGWKLLYQTLCVLLRIKNLFQLNSALQIYFIYSHVLKRLFYASISHSYYE